MALLWKVVICQVLFMCLVAADVQKKKRIKEYSHSVQFNEEIQSDSRLGIKSSQEDKQMKWGLDEYNEKYVDFSLRNARSISVKADDSASLSPDEVISNKYNTFNENSSVVNADGIWQTHQKPIPVMAIAEHLGKVIEQIAEKDLGVTRLKAKFQARNLGNKSGDQNATQHLNLLHEALQSRVDKYARLVLRMVDAALNKSRPNPYTRTTYNPCCLLPHHILMYDEKFGCNVNSEVWCDAGFGDGSDPTLVGFFSPPSATLTRMFLSNAAEFPELNWQYFMSSSGLLTEYPAHRPASSSVDALHPDGASSDCQNRGRHLRVYETTVRPQPKNILLLLDVGWSTMPRSLTSFVDAARLILSSLTPKDHVGVLSISDVPRSPDGRPCPDLLQPASSQRIASILRFLDKLNLDKSSPTNHTAGLARAFEAVARTAGDAPVVVAYFTSGAVDDRVTAAATHRALAPIAGPLYPRLRLAVLAADLRHLRSREYRGRQQLLRCLVAIADTGRPQRPPAPSAAECPLSLHHPRTPLGKTGVESHSLNTSVVSPAVLRLFDLLYPETVPGLAEQLHARTATQPPATAAPGRVSFVAAPPPLDYSTAVRLSTPHWDAHGQGVVVSVSGAVPCGVGDAACGVVGVDVSLSVLLHDILHHYTPLAGITSVVLHRSGEVLYHPVFGDTGSWGSPVTHDAGSWDSPVTRDAGSWGTPVTRTALQELEPVITDALQRRIVAQPTGHQTGPPDHTGGATHVWWRRLDRTAKDWILVVIRRPERRQRLLPLPSRDDGGGLLQASRDDGGDVLQASRDDGGD
ncbi:uncharacterized protein LOC108675120, partial [Hyalella azteca]|uniref:Uncharacterized protein LOC108675120 n=1 Tax=Hyalella azteca TaxID=294128 RepID=A0A8B7NXQ5_HYAAZ